MEEKKYPVQIGEFLFFWGNVMNFIKKKPAISARTTRNKDGKTSSIHVTKFEILNAKWANLWGTTKSPLNNNIDKIKL